MARISKADRDQATQFIVSSIQARIVDLKCSNASALAEAADKAKEKVDKKFGYTKTIKECDELRARIAKLEADLTAALRKVSLHPNAQYRSTANLFEELVKDAVQAAQERLSVGRSIREWEAAAKDAAKEVFLATSHEDLVAVVKRLSVY